MKFSRIHVVLAALCLVPFIGFAADKGKPVKVTSANFEEVVKNSDVPVLVDFWATWCGPCIAIAPTLDEIAKEYKGKVVIAKIDIDENGDLANQFGIRSIPNLKIFKNGKVVDEIVGAVPKDQITKKLDKQL